MLQMFPSHPPFDVLAVARAHFSIFSIPAMMEPAMSNTALSCCCHHGAVLMVLRVPAECPETVRDLIAVCMDADPADRPSAREIVEVLTSGDGRGLKQQRHLRRKPSTPEVRFRWPRLGHFFCDEWKKCLFAGAEWFGACL